MSQKKKFCQKMQFEPEHNEYLQIPFYQHKGNGAASTYTQTPDFLPIIKELIAFKLLLIALFHEKGRPTLIVAPRCFYLGIIT